MKRLRIGLALALIVLLGGCDEAHVQEQQLATGTAGGVLVLNNLAETVSLLDEGGCMHNDVQRTGRCPNDVVRDGHLLYLVNSLSNSLLVLRDDDLAVVREIHLGAGRNPYFAALVRPGILAVTEFLTGTLAVVDMHAGKVLGRVDLTGIALPADPGTDYKRFCYPQGVAVAGERIFVALTNLTGVQGGLTAAGPSVVAVIDAATLALETTIELSGRDAVFAMSHKNKIIVASAGHYAGNISASDPGGFVGDGTVEIIDPATLDVTHCYDLSEEKIAPFSCTVDDNDLLYTANTRDTGIGRVDLAEGTVLESLTPRRADGSVLHTVYLSGVKAVGDRLYALDFNDDKLFILQPDGAVVAEHLTGDGPIGLIPVADMDAGDLVIVPRAEVSSAVAFPGETLVFDAADTVVPAGKPCTFAWDFGDGTSGTGPRCTHTYGEGGTYTVTIVVQVVDGPAFSDTLTVPVLDESPFAAEVVSYVPAPGQFITNPSFNDPARALGPPSGGGVMAPDNSSLVSLGAFGGSITLAFDHPVKDDPANPGGLDFIVFGNAMLEAGGPARWAEAGVVEISADGSRWYLMPGSELKPAGSPAYARSERTYENGQKFSGYLLADGLTDGFAEDGSYIWGYADISPILEVPDGGDPLIFYTRPDDPRTPGIDEGTCGGDAFDIAWAVDPVTGQPAGLSSFTHIRITTAIDAVQGILGEISCEIDAVADVNP